VGDRALSAKSSPVETHVAVAADGDPIDLKDPLVAAVLAWLVPGLGHWYQGRRPKAVLFFTCIMGTFLSGLYIGEGRVVYASWRPNDRRLPYLCQVGVGLPALPALVQAHRFRDERVRLAAEDRERQGRSGFFDWFMVPPRIESPNHRHPDDTPDELDDIQKRLHRFFELGTVYTMIAGLLNVLAIYDAWGGPAFSEPVEGGKKKDDEK
jgi:uncharacterized protein DUF6677